MSPSAAAWLAGLREFAGQFRRSKPLAELPVREAAAQRTILAAHLSTWFDAEAPRLPQTHGIALTTSDTGLGVVADVLGRGEPWAEALRHRVAAVREIEYRLWTKDHPDPDHALHVNHWSWIKAPVPRQRWHEFRGFPLREGEDYWLHRTGTSGPGAEETRRAHLWKWTGAQAVLLESNVREGVDALGRPPDAHGP